MTNHLTQVEEYLCPGERRPISRAVHLGRLAAFYPACRECPRREDTGSLSPRQVEQLAETIQRRRPRQLFTDEGACGVFLSELAPSDVRRIAAAFGTSLDRLTADRRFAAVCKGNEADVSSDAERTNSTGEIVLAGDGRPIAAELVAAAVEGLRWSGREVIDIGPATAPCLAFAVNSLRAAGGLMIGNPGLAPQEVGLQFWLSGPRPLSTGSGLESLAQLADTEPSRPTRRFGPLRRFRAEESYLAAVAEHYHALRPLRIVVHSASMPMLDYLRKLCSTVACEIIPLGAARRDLPETVRMGAAHFAVQIDGDGETCRVFDEQGGEASAERLLLLLARHVEQNRPGHASACNAPKPFVALENSVSRAVAEQLRPLGFQTVFCGPGRSEVSAAMRKHGAVLGLGPGPRCWRPQAGVPLPDALMTVSWLLKILSRGDEPFSAVLDRDAPAG